MDTDSAVFMVNFLVLAMTILAATERFDAIALVQATALLTVVDMDSVVAIVLV